LQPERDRLSSAANCTDGGAVVLVFFFIFFGSD
jgi:hypothetical protein